MPSPTEKNTEKIEDLRQVLTSLSSGVDTLRRDVDKIEQMLASLVLLAPQVGDLRQWKDQSGIPDLKLLTARLNDQIEELKRWRDQFGEIPLKNELTLLKEKVSKLETAQEKTGNRLWMIVPPIVGALVSVLMAYFISKR